MIGWFLLTLAAAGQSAPQNPCAQPDACRRVESVRIETPAGKEITIPVNQTLPWIAEDNLLLFPGDSVTVRLIDRDGALVPQLVRGGAASATTTPGEGEIRVTVMPYNKGNLIMSVQSRRSDTLDYAAIIVSPGAKPRPQPTSVCSLMPGITVFESWTQPIQQIALTGFRPTTEPGCKTIDLKRKPPARRDQTTT